jgi:hypothetical protein
MTQKIIFDRLDENGHSTGEPPIVVYGTLEVHTDHTTRCTCPWTDETTWTKHGDSVEPGSQREYDPSCLRCNQDPV